MPDVERKSLTDLTARTATADSDLIHVNSGGTDYKEQKIDFLEGSLRNDFANNSLLTTQVDALAQWKVYFGTIGSYGHQSETGMPFNDNAYVKVQNTGYSSFIEVWSINYPQNHHWINRKVNNAWGDWERVPTRSEITSINNSLTKSSVAFTKHASVTGELINCYKLGNVLYISGYFKVSSTISSGSNFLNIPSITSYVLQYIFIHNASNQVSARLETASNNGNLCIKVSTAISGSEYHYISCAIVL